MEQAKKATQKSPNQNPKEIEPKKAGWDGKLETVWLLTWGCILDLGKALGGIALSCLALELDGRDVWAIKTNSK